MRINHKELEWARRKPQEYAGHLYSKQSKKSTGGGRGFYSFWRLAVLHYHKLTGDREEAINYYTGLVKKNLNDNAKNRKRLEQYVEHLNDYFDDYERLSYCPFETRKRVNIDIGSDFSIVGEIPRLDVVSIGGTAGGIAAYLFSKKQSDWTSELRFPLLQYYISKESGYALEETSIGMYCLESKRHQNVVFLHKRVDEAIEEARELADLISRLKPTD
jgi:hypothetical protein